MNAKLFGLLAALLPSAGPSAASMPPIITPAALRAHVETLASDLFEGRKPGTPGGDRTTFYIANAFREAGLAPGAGGNSWYQPVALATRTPVSARLSWTMGRRRHSAPAGSLIAVGEGAHERLAGLPLLFVGHGVSIDGGRDDLAGANLRGAAVLMLADGKVPLGAPSLNERRRMLAERGAAAVILIQRAGRGWSQVEQAFGSGRTALRGAAMPRVEAYLSKAGADALFRSLRLDPAAADAPGFRAQALGAPVTLEVETKLLAFEAANVIGVIPGRDLAGEALVYLAHWDHLGICRPAGAADRICNGAVDNASGTGALIEIARALASGRRPERSIYFVATTAEEMGLLGARSFAAAPPVPLDRIVAALNLDTVAVAPAGMPVAIIGRGRTALDPLVESAARGLGRSIDRDDEANAFIERQDGWELAKRGVPAIMVGGAFSDLKLLERFLAGPYHGPSDDLSRPLLLDGAAEDASLHVVLGRLLADPRRYPAPPRAAPRLAANALDQTEIQNRNGQR